MKDEEMKKTVKEGYAKLATHTTCQCCGDTPTGSEVSGTIGYSRGELESIPEGSDMGLGCGNPVALASLRKGETVLDLGSGGGIDCFLAAKRVGESGTVIGVDMTPEMVKKATENAKSAGYRNVEFRLGDIENLPVEDNTVDVIISNCVINLSPDKSTVFREAFRVMKPGGRMMISDMVLLKELPEAVRKNAQAYVGCLAGAMLRDEYIGLIKMAGFREVVIIDKSGCTVETAANDPTVQAMMRSFNLSEEEAQDVLQSVISVTVEARKPD